MELTCLKELKVESKEEKKNICEHVAQPETTEKNTENTKKSQKFQLPNSIQQIWWRKHRI